MVTTHTLPTNTFTLTRPVEQTNGAVFSSPHSGSFYPKEFLAISHLEPIQLRSSEDAYVDELVAAAPDFGAPLISAEMPRAWLDLNRSADELDPALISGVDKNSRSPRINAGLGVIPRVVSDSRVIQHGKISREEAEWRIARFHTPFHSCLESLLFQSREKFGQAILFDFHSMPHEALSGSTMVNGARPEIVLGDRFGASCDRWIMEAALEIFRSAGFRVVRNAPFAGGYITQTYGQPSKGIHAMQIEIDRDLYMDEKTLEKKPRFGSFHRQLSSIVRKLAALGQENISIAAE